jgi:hypothetical protein
MQAVHFKGYELRGVVVELVQIILDQKFAHTDIPDVGYLVGTDYCIQIKATCFQGAPCSIPKSILS